MASASLELVRSIFAAWERGDFSSADWAHPEIEFELADGPTPGRGRGVRKLAEAWRDLLGGWDEFRAEAEEYIELGAGRVLASLALYWDREQALAELGMTSPPPD